MSPQPSYHPGRKDVPLRPDRSSPSRHVEGARASRSARGHGLRRRGQLGIGGERSVGRWLGCGPLWGPRRTPSRPGFRDRSGSAALLPLSRSGFPGAWGSERDCVRGLGLWSLRAGRWALDVEVGRWGQALSGYRGPGSREKVEGWRPWSLGWEGLV